MPINGQTTAATEAQVSAPGTSETNFQDGMDAIIAQVDRSVNAVNFTDVGTTVTQMTGMATLPDGHTDNTLDIAVTAVAGTIPAASINPAHLRRIRVLNSGGGAVATFHVFQDPIGT